MSAMRSAVDNSAPAVICLIFFLAAFSLAACHHKVISDHGLDRRAIVEMGKRVSHIRRLPFVERVRFRLVDRAAVARMAGADSDKRRFAGQADCERKWLFLLGLIPAWVDPAVAAETIVTSRPAGLYLPERKCLQLVYGDLVRSEILETIDMFLGRDLTYGEILAHELTHTLQDQHFGLDPPSPARGNSDARLAHMALAEGDATLVGFELGVGGLLTDAQSFFAFARRHAPDFGRGVPSFLAEKFKFPYLDGSAFVLELREAGDWEAVDRAHRSPPLSSEQVLHPQKYLAGTDRPRLPDLAGVRAPGTGFVRIHEDTLGEFGIRVMLSGAAGPAAARMAAGWGGDRGLVFEHVASRELVLLWVIDFDTPADAADFFSGLESFVSRRSGAATEAGISEATFRSGGRYRRLELFENRVVYTDTPGDIDAYRLVMQAFRAKSRVLSAVEPRPADDLSPGEPERLFAVDETPVPPPGTGIAIDLADDSRALEVGALLQTGGRRGADKGLGVFRMRARAHAEVTRLLDLKLHLELELSGRDDLLQDAALSFAPVSPKLFYIGHFWTGRFRVPFSQAVLVDAENLPFLERPFVVRRLSPLRRTGLLFDFDAWHYGVPLRVRAGAFDGFPEGEGHGPLAVVRLDFEPGLWLRGHWNLRAGFAYANDKGHLGTEGTAGGEHHGLVFDLGLSYRGFGVAGEYLLFDRAKGGGFETSGWVVRAEAFLLPDFLQLVGRYEELKRPGLATLRAAGAGAKLFYLSRRFVMSYEFGFQAQTGVADETSHMLLFQLLL